MRDANGRVGRVDRLPAGAGGAEGVDAEVFVLDFDVYFFSFGEHSYCDGGGVDAALGFGRRDTLDAMYAGLVLHLRIDLLAFEDGGNVLQAANVGISLREDFNLPLVLLRETEVHAEHLGNKERGLVATRAGA